MGCNKLKARDQLNKGVESYKNNHYEQAIDHFQKAVQLDPGLINARMYLATAFVSQYIPGVDSPDNLRTAQTGDQGVSESHRRQSLPRSEGEHRQGHRLSLSER